MLWFGEDVTHFLVLPYATVYFTCMKRNVAFSEFLFEGNFLFVGRLVDCDPEVHTLHSPDCH